jgi:hypothetical protein
MMLDNPALASFFSPIQISTTPQSLLYALPLLIVIAVVYKATKFDEIKFLPFFRESIVLFVSILFFMVITAIGIYLFIRLTIG